ncbi:hypothetical protein AGMMS49975_05950 [Clostridia bacterium]|nr:hypothetical protein AGMMS49975_05950 [Clostridia bacterium]
MKNTKIDWADATWNPVTGCNHDCQYCYARGIAKRFAGFESRSGGEIIPNGKGVARLSGNRELVKVTDSIYATTHGEPLHVFGRQPQKRTKNGSWQKAVYPYGFEPTLHRYNLDVVKAVGRKPKTVFVCSMADLFGEWVQIDWIKAVFDACQNAPQHRYLFFTKNPARFNSLYDEMPKGENFYYGYSKAQGEIQGFRTDINSFVSIEPLLGEVSISPLAHLNWIIVGAETGNRKGKITPKREWLDEILAYSEQTDTPVFMKDSLLTIVGEENMRREFSW